MSSDDELVRVGDRGPVTTITLTRTRRLNALNGALVAAVVAALGDCVGRGQRAVILRAEPGVRTWSAGHDVAELPTDGSDPLTWSSPLEELLRTVRQVPIPVIAAVEGGVWGGACDLVFTCDLVVAAEAATFAITPAKLGVPYNTAGVSHFVGVMPLHLVKELFFTAEPMTAQVAAQHGLVNRVVADSDDLTATVEGLADRVAQMAPLVIRAVKAELTALTDASPMTPEVFEQLTGLRRASWRSRDYEEGLAAFHERRPARFTGE
ncbi:MAG: methylmalonyl-CoA decarboxylase [Candidatus Nanopelagicales bacterium]